MNASAPGMFGDPAEDCNCRCALLQRARWALDETELDTLKERSEYFGLDKSKDFEDFKEKIAGNETVLVDFYAVWCGPCKMTAPIIEEIAAEAQDFKVYKVDVDNVPDAAVAYGVSSIPTIISFKGGKEHARHIGYGDKNTLLALLK